MRNISVVHRTVSAGRNLISVGRRTLVGRIEVWVCGRVVVVLRSFGSGRRRATGGRTRLAGGLGMKLAVLGGRRRRGRGVGCLKLENPRIKILIK